MFEKVSIVVCYRAGTGSMMAAWMASVYRHTKEIPYKVIVLTTKGDAELVDLLQPYLHMVSVHEVNLPESQSSGMHGAMLDSFVPYKVETEFVVTMDSDCMPVADGWLSELIGKLESGEVAVAGILHPWSPPPDDMEKNLIEYRVRSQHCWNVTHVACQAMATARLAALGARFNAGDDTGLLIPAKAKANGWDVGGFRVTRCAKPELGKADPEFNRHVSLIFGDKVYHCGGFTRVMTGDKPSQEEEFGWARKRVIVERGAEFLLDDEMSYRYKFDREPQVSKDSMERIFGMRKK